MKKKMLGFLRMEMLSVWKPTFNPIIIRRQRHWKLLGDSSDIDAGGRAPIPLHVTLKGAGWRGEWRPFTCKTCHLKEFIFSSGESSEGSGDENKGESVSTSEEDSVSFDGVHVQGQPSWMTHHKKPLISPPPPFPPYTEKGCLWSQLKSVGGKLVPFLKTLGLYFVIFIPEDDPSFVAMALKCLPILSLALFVTLNGMSLGKQHRFARHILGGLLSSCLGDALLIWPSYFLHGMAAFALAQCFYIRAFGFRPLNLKLGAFIFALSSTSLWIIGPGVVSSGPLSLSIGVILYSCLLGMMTWRALAPIQKQELSLSRKLCSSLGAISFVISDSVLAINKFYTHIPHYQVIIMGTYYTAQLALALSVVNPKDAQLPKEQNEEESQRSNQIHSSLVKGVI